MKKSIIFFLLLFSITVSAVQITEIMYDYPGSDDGHEWIEIYSEECIELENWIFFEQETNHRLYHYAGQSTVCKDYAVIVESPEQFLKDYPNFSGNIYDSYFILKNSDGVLAMKNPSKEIVEETKYINAYAKGDGFTLETTPDGWISSIVEGGTPGQKNSVDETNIPEKVIDQDIPESDTKNDPINSETPPQPELITETSDYDPITNNNTEQDAIASDTDTNQETQPATGFVTLESPGITIDIDPIEIVKSLLQEVWELIKNSISNLFSTTPETPTSNSTGNSTQ
jgi:hypothetical protein